MTAETLSLPKKFSVEDCGKSPRSERLHAKYGFLRANEVFPGYALLVDAANRLRPGLTGIMLKKVVVISGWAANPHADGSNQLGATEQHT